MRKNREIKLKCRVTDVLASYTDRGNNIKKTVPEYTVQLERFAKIMDYFFFTEKPNVPSVFPSDM